MTRSRYGWLAGIAGAALATWYWRRRHNHGESEKGDVIYNNTPIAGSEGIL